MTTLEFNPSLGKPPEILIRRKNSGLASNIFSSGNTFVEIAAVAAAAVGVGAICEGISDRQVDTDRAARTLLFQFYPDGAQDFLSSETEIALEAFSPAEMTAEEAAQQITKIAQKDEDGLYFAGLTSERLSWLIKGLPVEQRSVRNFTIITLSSGEGSVEFLLAQTPQGYLEASMMSEVDQITGKTTSFAGWREAWSGNHTRFWEASSEKTGPWQMIFGNNDIGGRDFVKPTAVAIEPQVAPTETKTLTPTATKTEVPTVAPTKTKTPTPESTPKPTVRSPTKVPITLKLFETLAPVEFFDHNIFPGKAEKATKMTPWWNDNWTTMENMQNASGVFKGVKVDGPILSVFIDTQNNGEMQEFKYEIKQNNKVLFVYPRENDKNGNQVGGGLAFEMVTAAGAAAAIDYFYEVNVSYIWLQKFLTSPFPDRGFQNIYWHKRK